MTVFEATKYAVKDRAAWITLSRPENRNALTVKMINELYYHIQHANSDEKVRCIVLTGAGKSFCAGADLKRDRSEKNAEKPIPFADVLTAMWESRKPVISVVNGAAFGGGLGLVGASDIVIADVEAQFSFSEVRIGVIPAIISVVCVRKLGYHHAMKLFITGERFKGNRAVEMGLVHQAVAEGDLKNTVGEIIEMINLGGPGAVVECKKLVRRVAELSIPQGFEETTAWSARMFASEEAAEGMAAFREKRRPSWVKSK